MRTNRTGATLMEVLMAILIMGIGLVSIASLFPISVLRSAKANHLTHATAHRYNAEQLLKSFPTLLKDPDAGDQNGDINTFNDQQGLNFLIDPQALSQNSPLNGNTVVGQMFRYDGLSAHQQTAQWAGPPSQVMVDWLSMSQDNWKTRFQAVGTNLQTGPPQSIAVAGLSGENIFLNPGSYATRAVIFNAAGTTSVTRDLLPANNAASPLGNSIAWTPPLPGGFIPGMVLIQHQSREFTWMLTVRNENSSTPDVTVTVFHNRDFNPIYDTAYSNGGNPNDSHGSDQDQNGNQGFRVFHEGFSLAYVTWPQGAQAPFLKKGGWVLDTSSGFWYQIEGFVTGTATVGGNATNWASITLDSPAKDSSDPGLGVAVFPKGIVDVFPIGAVK